VTPSVSVSELVFSRGTTIKLNVGDVVVIVGPNNGGKSATLRAIRDKIADPKVESPIVTSLLTARTGSSDDVAAWIPTIARRNKQLKRQDVYDGFGTSVSIDNARNVWSSRRHDGFQSLGRFFCHLLTADERLTAADPAQAVSLTNEAITNPIHFLQRDDRLELRLSDHFRKAFGSDLIVHRNAGNVVPLHVGQRPIPEGDDDRVSYSYITQLERLPTLETQGDGMRSFAGVLLHVYVGPESILLIDEPEAFLHPPQARLLGRMLVTNKPPHRQLFIATHSGDVLRGVLDGNPGNVRVVRIRREGDVNPVKELAHDQVRSLWKDPLLRSSNILDGVFHERVVVTEGDADVRFFAAVMDAMYEGPLAGQRKPDVMFTHTGGKDRLPMVVRSLRALDVPVRVVPDFDILNSDNPLKKLVEAAGGDWSVIEQQWNSVRKAIDAIKTQLSTTDVKRDIDAILNGVTNPVFPKDSKKKIEEILKQTSAWALAKKSGKAFIPSGTPTQEYNKLAAELRRLGVFIVEVGELERFYPAAGGHGPAWVNEVLTKDLIRDPDLQGAREFVTNLLT
jgi:hypothetical protein